MRSFAFWGVVALSALVCASTNAQTTLEKRPEFEAGDVSAIYGADELGCEFNGTINIEAPGPPEIAQRDLLRNAVVNPDPSFSAQVEAQLPPKFDLAAENEPCTERGGKFYPSLGIDSINIPLPAATAYDNITPNLFQKIGQVSNDAQIAAFINALQNHGYAKPVAYDLKPGLLIVLPVERVYRDGRPLEGDLRWLGEGDQGKIFAHLLKNDLFTAVDTWFRRTIDKKDVVTRSFCFIITDKDPSGQVKTSNAPTATNYSEIHKLSSKLVAKAPLQVWAYVYEIDVTKSKNKPIKIRSTPAISLVRHLKSVLP